MNNLVAGVSRLKRALGLPETISVLGMARMCPILMFFGLLIVAALGVMALS
jgi:hypothetical protein